MPSWFSFEPSSGTEADPLVVTVDSAGLEPGYYLEYIEISSADGDTSLPVSLHVGMDEFERATTTGVMVEGSWTTQVISIRYDGCGGDVYLNGTEEAVGGQAAMGEVVRRAEPRDDLPVETA